MKKLGILIATVTLTYFTSISVYAGDMAQEINIGQNETLQSTPEQNASQSMTIAPYVNPIMCTPEYWIDRQHESDKVLMNQAQITNLNTTMKSIPETNMHSLSTLEENFDGKTLANKLSSFTTPEGVYLNESPVPETFYEAIRENIRNSEVSENMALRYGVAVNHTLIKAYPYSEYLSDGLNDPEWDNFANSSAQVNTPLAVYFLTGDRKYAYVKTSNVSGWVPFEDIAICKNKQEWEAVYKTESFLVVTEEKIYLEASYDLDISEKKLAMGTVLPLEKNPIGLVANRMPWNNYVVMLPTRTVDGSFIQKQALIPANRDVSVGYLPLTQENIVRQAFKLLGNRYGWGGMLDSQDCSMFVRDIYRCFGLDIPRNTTWQYQMPVEKYDLTLLSEQEKATLLDSLLPGTILQFPGHEMIYLGNVNGRYYTINDVSTLVNSLDEAHVPLRIRSVIVCDLFIERRNEKRWYDELNHAIVPWGISQ